MKRIAALMTVLALMLAFSACGALSQVTDMVNELASSSNATSEGGKLIEGKPGEKVTTYFFDFTLNDAKEVDAAQVGHTLSSEDNKLIVVDVTIKNIDEESIPMYYDDFALDNNDFEDYLFPVENAGYPDQLQNEFELAPSESATGKLYFEVPSKYSAFYLMTMDFFEEDIEGDTYSVRFTV